MKQNKNSSVIRVLAFLIAVVVLLFSLSVSSFAYTDSSTNGELFTVFQSSDYTQHSNAFLWASSDTGNYKSRFYFSGDSLGQDFICAAYGDPTYYTVLVAFPNASSGFGGGFYYSNTNTNYTYLSSTSSATSSQPYVYFYTAPIWWSGNVTPMPNITLADGIPIFATRSDALAALRDYISDPTPPSSGTPHALSLTVPAGNAVYIDVTGISTVSASLSMSSEVAHPLNWTSNQYYGFSSSYPLSISGNPSGSTPIPWTGYGDKTLFNRYKTFRWSLTSVGSSNYLFIVNPYASLDEYDQSFNPTIYLNVAEAIGYKYYQLTGGISSDGTIGQQSDGTTASGTYDDTSETWVTTNDQTGLPWTPSEGGGNIITQNSINSWLQTISTQIGNFFSGAIGAVTTLVSAGSDFIHSLSGLYAWLPPPVYSILVSALILVITIGVIKVFI